MQGKQINKNNQTTPSAIFKMLQNNSSRNGIQLMPTLSQQMHVYVNHSALLFCIPHPSRQKKMFLMLQKMLKLQLNFHERMHLCCFCSLKFKVKTWAAAYGKNVSTLKTHSVSCWWWNSDSWGPIHLAEPVSVDSSVCVNSNDEIYTAAHYTTRLLKLRDAKVNYARFTASVPKHGNAVKEFGN